MKTSSNEWGNILNARTDHNFFSRECASVRERELSIQGNMIEDNDKSENASYFHNICDVIIIIRWQLHMQQDCGTLRLRARFK